MSKIRKQKHFVPFLKEYRMSRDCKVYIGDLDPEVDKREVEDAFGKIGQLK